MKSRDSGTLPPHTRRSVQSCFPLIFGSNSSSKVANYQRYLIPAILTIYSHGYPRENLLLSGKGTFSFMFFTFAPLVGVEYFWAFLGRERCVLCFCALKKKTPGHPLREMFRRRNIHDVPLEEHPLNSGIAPIRITAKSLSQHFILCAGTSLGCDFC